MKYASNKKYKHDCDDASSMAAISGVNLNWVNSSQKLRIRLMRVKIPRSAQPTPSSSYQSTYTSFIKLRAGLETAFDWRTMILSYDSIQHLPSLRAMIDKALRCDPQSKADYCGWCIQVRCKWGENGWRGERPCLS